MIVWSNKLIDFPMLTPLAIYTTSNVTAAREYNFFDDSIHFKDENR